MKLFFKEYKSCNYVREGYTFKDDTYLLDLTDKPSKEMEHLVSMESQEALFADLLKMPTGVYIVIEVMYVDKHEGKGWELGFDNFVISPKYVFYVEPVTSYGPSEQLPKRCINISNHRDNWSVHIYTEHYKSIVSSTYFDMQKQLVPTFNNMKVLNSKLMAAKLEAYKVLEEAIYQKVQSRVANVISIIEELDNYAKENPTAKLRISHKGGNYDSPHVNEQSIILLLLHVGLAKSMSISIEIPTISYIYVNIIDYYNVQEVVRDIKYPTVGTDKIDFHLKSVKEFIKLSKTIQIGSKPIMD